MFYTTVWFPNFSILPERNAWIAPFLVKKNVDTRCFTHLFWSNCQCFCKFLIKYKANPVILWKFSLDTAIFTVIIIFLKIYPSPDIFTLVPFVHLFHVWLSIPWNGILIEKKSFYISIMLGWEHTSYLSRTRGRCPCKFFLAGVNFYRFNAKNWRFSV